MSASVPLAAIKKMLSRCAKGYQIEEKVHHHWVTYKGKTFCSLPKGYHGARVPEVEIGHIVGMIRYLGIDEKCAHREIPQLPKLKPSPGGGPAVV
jgi:hypothetical protein